MDELCRLMKSFINTKPTQPGYSSSNISGAGLLPISSELCYRLGACQITMCGTGMQRWDFGIVVVRALFSCIWQQGAYLSQFQGIRTLQPLQIGMKRRWHFLFQVRLWLWGAVYCDGSWMYMVFSHKIEANPCQIKGFKIFWSINVDTNSTILWMAPVAQLRNSLAHSWHEPM